MAKPSIVSLPYTYEVRGVLKGHRNETSVFFQDDVLAEIPRVGNSDAPVAVRVKDRRTGVIDIEQRAWNRRPVEPVMGANMDEPVTNLRDLKRAAENLRSGRDSWNGYPIQHIRKGTLYGTIPADKDAVEFRRVTANLQDEARASAEEIARSLVFVDGTLYSPAQEVQWTVGQRSEFTLMSIIRGGASDELFRGDRRSDAVRYAKALAKFHRHETVRSKYDLEDEGLIDWSFDDVNGSVAKAVQTTLGLTMGSFANQLAWMPEVFFPALCELRQFHKIDITAQNRLAAVSALRSVMEAVRERPEKAADLRNRIWNTLNMPMWRYSKLDGLNPDLPAEDIDALAELAPDAGLVP